MNAVSLLPFDEWIRRHFGHRVKIGIHEFTLVADPTCPKDEIRVYDRGELIHTEKIQTEWTDGE